MKILSNEPIGKDLFEGQSQERIADLIFKSLEAARSSRDAAVRISGNSVVGIEGGWGCGKSNVLKILEAKLDGVLENKKKVYSVFLYDLWGRQQDLQRKTILQDLAAHLKNKCHIDKDKEVRELIIKKTEVGQEFVKKGLFARLLPVVLSGFVTVFLATAALSKEDSWMRNISGWMALGVGVVVCICGAISLWKYKDDAFAAITEFLGNMLLIKTNGAELPRMMYEHQYSVTVSDFSKLLTEIASELVTKERHLIVVFDNIDRLPIDKVKEFLSSAHILFAERKETMLTNIHVIIPFDRNRILTAFDGQDGNDYINKTFDVVYRVAPPILKDWEKFFLERYQEATADEPVLLSQSLEVQDVFNVLSSPRNLTPRAIIAFLNSITAAHNVLGDSVPLKAIAVHELAWKPYEQKMALDKGEASKPEASELNETRIRNGRFISNALLQAKYLGDENWQKWMAAIVFQVEASRAGEILNFNLLKDALENGRSEDVLKMSDLPSFRMLFRRILPTVRTPERIPAAIHNIGEENRQWCWDEVNDTRGNDIARISTDPIGFDDWHRNMLKNVSDWRGYARAFLQLDVPIDSRGPIEGQFKRSCDVDKALKESDRTLVNAFHAQRVEPAQYLGILRVAKDRVDVMGWECNPEVFDDYIAKLNISSGAAFGIEWLPEEIALKMPKTKQAFEGLTAVADPSMPRGMMVNTTLEILERLSKGMVKMSLRDEFKRDFILDGHKTERENCRAYAVALGMNLDVPASSGLYKFGSSFKSVGSRLLAA